MKTKIKALALKGIRGVREKFGLNLDGKSILIYGDNGTEKVHSRMHLNGFIMIR